MTKYRITITLTEGMAFRVGRATMAMGMTAKQLVVAAVDRYLGGQFLVPREMEKKLYQNLKALPAELGSANIYKEGAISPPKSEKPLHRLTEEKPPTNEPEKLFWYAGQLEKCMGSERWRWSPYQCVIYFAAMRKKAIGDFGSYSIQRDNKLMRSAKATLAADKYTIRDGIDAYFKNAKNDDFQRKGAYTVPLFSSALAKVKSWMPRPSADGGPVGCLGRDQCQRYQLHLKYSDEGEELPDGTVLCEADGKPYKVDGDQFIPIEACDGSYGNNTTERV